MKYLGKQRAIPCFSRLNNVKITFLSKLMCGLIMKQNALRKDSASIYFSLLISFWFYIWFYYQIELLKIFLWSYLEQYYQIIKQQLFNYALEYHLPVWNACWGEIGIKNPWSSLLHENKERYGISVKGWFDQMIINFIAFTCCLILPKIKHFLF